MKLKDLISEVRIFQNNFIKIDVVKDELKRILGDEAPEVEFDEDGLFIKLDNITFRNYEMENGFEKFSLIDGGLIDEIKNISKYYIEYMNIETDMEDSDESSETDSEEEKTES